MTFNLTNQQEEIWLIENYYNKTGINNIIGWLRIDEAVNFDALKKGINIFLENNDGLRLRLIIENDKIKQYVKSYEYIKVEKIHLKDMSEIGKLEEILRNQRFNLLDSDLYKFYLFEFDDKTGGACCTISHLVSDAWTMNLIIKTWMDVYFSIKNKNEVVDVKKPSYVTYINSQEEYNASEKCNKDLIYWKEKYEKLPNILNFKQAENISVIAERKEYLIKEKTYEKIKKYCSENKISEYIFFLAIYSIYFSKMYGIDNYVIGNPILNRTGISEKQMAGMFVSTLPFIVNIDFSISVKEYMEFLAKEQMSMYKHLKYPYKKILNMINKNHDRQGNIYDLIFSYQNAKVDNSEYNFKYESSWVHPGQQVESLMIHIKDTDSTGAMHVLYDYLVDVFKESDIEKINQRINNLIEQILDGVNNIKDLDVILKSELQMIDNFNDTKVEYNKNSNIVLEFEKQLLQNKDKIALEFENEKVTYYELNNMANIIAKEIINKGVKSKSIVALMLPRGIQMFATVLGILKASCTYLPIEAEYPKERVEYMLTNSKAQLLITNAELSNDEQINKLLIDNIDFTQKEINLQLYDIDSNDVAYIMYTSGSTGNPKAVMIRHYSVINFSNSMKNKLNFIPTEENISLSITTICFDIFVFEFFPSILNGIHIVIANKEQQKNPKEMSDLFINKNISRILTTPSRVNLLFLDEKYSQGLKNIKEIVLGGEPFPEELLINLKRVTNAKIYNLYGPTETTVYSTFKELTNEVNITIGKPIDNTQIYILGQNNEFLPIDSVGEIGISGDGVAKGYYLNEKLTNEKFVNKQIKGKNKIVYKTGDLGKWLPNGELICIGRKDNQIKIRGFRVELGEIESKIGTYNNIKQVVVNDLLNDKNEKYLCAYYVSDLDIDIKLLKEYLSTKLPDYMVPTYYMKVNEMPLTINHKVDRKKLPIPKANGMIRNVEYVAPTNEIEKNICGMFEEVLKLTKIGINDNIFDYNVDSLKIIEIQIKMLKFNYNLITQDFYDLKTIRNIAKKVLEQQDNIVKQQDNVQEEFDIELKKTNLININNKNIKFKTKIYIDNILLTGVTGFLGMHILDYILKNTNSKIYCLMREKDNENVQERFIDRYKFYFGTQDIDYSRVIIIKADLGKEQFDLSDMQYQFLRQNINVVIHSAANVKYYGNYLEFKKINIDITNNLADFCKNSSIPLAHISTTGISGNYLVGQANEMIKFDETDFYIGQKYDENVYIKSKFLAEKSLLEKRKDGLKLAVFRVGNLVGRYSDGVFQPNIEQNSFYNIIKFMLTYKMLPNEMLKRELEFTSIDLCAEAVVKMIEYNETFNNVFHIFNNNTICIKKLIKYLEKMNYKIQIMNKNEFSNEVLKLSLQGEKALKGIINDIDIDEGLTFTPNVKIENKWSNKCLAQINFTWPKIEYEYIFKIIKKMKEVGYIK